MTQAPPDRTPPHNERQRGTRRHLKFLEELNLFLARTPDPQESLEGVVQMLAAATDCEVCSLYSYDRETETLSLAATQGLPARSIGRVAMSKSEGLVGLVVEEQGPVAVVDALVHPRFKFFPDTGEEKYHSFLGVPVGEGSLILGVLVIQSRRRRRFDPEEISLARAVAGQVRALMINAHLAERLQHQEEERERYRREMHKAIQRLEAMEASKARVVKQAPEGAVVYRTGLAAAPGFGIGRAHRVQPPVDLEKVELVEGRGCEVEHERFQTALTASIAEMEEARLRMRELVPEVGGAIFEALRMMIEDRSFAARIHEEVEKGLSAESAVKVVVLDYVARFEAMTDAYLRERAADVREAGQRILHHLLGVDGAIAEVRENAILVAHELSVTDLAALDHTRLRGIVTASGGVTSHAAILAKSLGIPTVVGVGGVYEDVREGADVIVDGNSGTVYLRPGAEVVAEYQRLDSEYHEFQRGLEHLRSLPGETLDGHRVSLLANVGLVSELDLLDRYGAEGIGLYRTEFPFLSYREFPTEDEQLRVYRRLLARMKGRPVTIRTLDLGADKYPIFAGHPHEGNPFLGLRSIRISLQNEDVFLGQLRAIVRAAEAAPLRILFPMITSVEELRRVRELYAECLSDLVAEGFTAPTGIELGAMIEVPAAVLRAPQILREVDFVSIGTNDLIQYTLAVDRDNINVASMYEPLHPAVLQSIRMVVAAAHESGRRVGMCGEMAGNPVCTVLLLGLGLDELSMGSLYVPVVKQIIRSVRYDDAARIADDVLRCDTIEEVKGYVFAALRERGLLELVDTFS
ncbi:MAG: phosphoenolpyruvate--protein phosphotransferase [Deltaproteobacteria bacterium]|nr:phosphoenolpyruvate--protein phosphotransferase [Deltaproteobacteria bacterium]